jgi:hypothetical protein
MSLTEEQERHLLALIGRVETLENARGVDLSQLALLSYVNRMLPLAGTCRKETPTENIHISAKDPSLWFIDSGGVGNWTVYMPEMSKSNGFYIIINTGESA